MRDKVPSSNGGARGVQLNRQELHVNLFTTKTSRLTHLFEVARVPLIQQAWAKSRLTRAFLSWRRFFCCFAKLGRLV